MRQLKILLYHSDQGKMEWEQKGQKAMSTSIYNFEMKKKKTGNLFFFLYQMKAFSLTL